MANAQTRTTVLPTANLQVDNKEGGSNPKAEDKKRKGNRKGPKDHPEKRSVAAIAGEHPVLLRYLHFTRNFLSIIQAEVDSPTGLKISSPEMTTRLAEFARSFYYSECAMSGTARAIPLPKGGKEKKKPETRNPAIVTPEPKKEKTEQSKIAQFLPLVTGMTRLKDKSGAERDITSKTASALNKERTRERAIRLENLKKDTRRVLNLALAHTEDDAKCIAEANMSETLKSLGALPPNEQRTPVTYFKEVAHHATDIALVVNAVDVKQFAVLRENRRLMTTPHIKSYLTALSTLPSLYEEKWQVLPENFSGNSEYTVEEMNWNMGTPYWPKVRNLGRAHPKIICLQMMEWEGTEEELKLMELFCEVFSNRVFRERGGPYELSRAPDDNDEDYHNKCEKVKVALRAKGFKPDGAGAAKSQS